MKPAPLFLLLSACTGKTTETGTPTEGTDTAAGDLTPVHLRCPTTADPRFDGLAAIIDAERASLGAPGMAVALVEDGAVVWCGGFGDKHPEAGGEVLPSTLFRMGSVNKMMTATALLQQVDAGRAALADPVIAHLPDFSLAYSPGYTEITLSHLLTHQGGFYDYLLIDSDAEDDALAEAVEGWFDTTEVLISPPGAFWNYANPNWYVAGRVVEKLDGRYYRAYMAEEVFAPLWMERTVFTGEEVLADGDYASGLTTDWTGQTAGTVIAEPDSYDNAWGRPAGYAWTSAEELARFAIFMMNGESTVLSDALRAEMMAEQVDLQYIPGLQHYGYGLFTDRGLFVEEGDFRPLNLVYHGGDISGFAADLYMVPDQNVALAVLANADAAHVTDTLLAALALLVEMPAATDAPDLSPAADLAPFEGSYSEPWNIVGDFTITAEDGTLHIDLPVLNTHGFSYSTTLTPYVGSTFVFTVTDYPMLLTFIEADGTMYARTRIFVGAEELDAALPPAPRSFSPRRLREALRSLPPVR